MRITHIMAGAALLGALCAPGAAAAANAFTTGNVNMRAGPSTQFPRVTTLPEGVTVTIHGCVSGWSWCDTSWRGWRGWVSGRYLEQLYDGRRVLVPEYGPSVGVPIISFHFGNYWDRWYSDRPWYRDRPRWRRSWEQNDWSWRDGDRDWRRDRYRDRDWSDRRDRDRDGDRARDRDRDGDRRVIQRESTRERLSNDRERARRGATVDPPRVIRRNRGNKSCPPGLAKQGRC